MDRRDFFGWVRNGLASARRRPRCSYAKGRCGSKRRGSPARPSPALPALRAEGQARHPHLPVRGLEPRRLVRLQARVDPRRTGSRWPFKRASPTCSSGRSAASARRTGRSASRGESRALGLGPVPRDLAGVADELTVIRSMVRRDLEPHAGRVPAELAASGSTGIPALGAWLSYGLGSGGRRPARLRGHPRRPRAARRRGDPLEQRLPPRAAPGGDDPVARGSPSKTSSPPGPIKPGAESRRPRARRGDEPPTTWKRRTRATTPSAARIKRLRAWPPGCRRRCRSVARPRLGEAAETRSRCTASTAPRSADFGRSCLLARRLLERGRAVRATVLRRHVRLAPGGTGTGTRT